MEMKKVSVLMPNYNNGPYIKEALDSLFNQTYTDFIIYFVDDCSTDNSISIASMYDASRIRIIQKNGHMQKRRKNIQTLRCLCKQN